MSVTKSAIGSSVARAIALLATTSGGGGGGGSVNATDVVGIVEVVQDAAAQALTHSNHTGVTVVYDDAANQIKLQLSGLTSASLSDFTEAAQDAAAALLTSGTHSGVTVAYDDASNKINLTVTASGGGGATTSAGITDFTEAAQDAAAALLTGGTHSGISVVYDDASNKLNLTVTGGGGGATTSAGISDFTEAAQDAAAALLTAGVHTGLTATYDDAGNRVSLGLNWVLDGANAVGFTGYGGKTYALLERNANGTVPVNVIPRTNTLANLLTLAGGAGELSVASDAPALVKHSGVAGGAVGFYPFSSVKTLSAPANGTIGTVTIDSDVISVQRGAAAVNSTATLTLGSGSNVGQIVYVHAVDSDVGLSVSTVRGGTTVVAGAVNAGRIGQFVWRGATGGWVCMLVLDALHTRVGLNSTGIGRFAVATGENSIAVNATASGASAIAIGGGSGIASAAGNSAIAIGPNANAAGSSAVAISARADGVSSTAIGSGSRTISLDSLAVGRNNRADGISSVAIGAGARAQVEGQMVLSSPNLSHAVFDTSVRRTLTSLAAEVPAATATMLTTDGAGANDPTAVNEFKLPDFGICLSSIRVTVVVMTSDGVKMARMVRELVLKRDGTTTTQIGTTSTVGSDVNGGFASQPTVALSLVSGAYLRVTTTAPELATAFAYIESTDAGFSLSS